MSRRTAGLVAAALFVAVIAAANLAIDRWGPVPVGFGLTAPAGVYLAGVAFLNRDLVHELLGLPGVLAAIAAGAAVSALTSPRLAAASAAAFTVSELVDLAVYAPLRRTRLAAVVASNVAGLVVDSVVFLALAFGSLAFLPGQLVGKSWVTVATVVVWLGWRVCVSTSART